ncbi:non-hydrolyzing UDP-N-acetylglucosamine 2-epimerase [Thermoproteota archaeon]
MKTNPKKIISIVGARPQFIKLAPLSREIRKKHNEIILHTGQHFDKNMSAVFFEQMGIPEPDVNLGIGLGTHAEQTGKMLMGIEAVYLEEKPDLVIVFGDTNSTLAGALAASKLCIPVLHVEAGLRSYDRSMPEEQNRILTDHLSSYLACPSRKAVRNLEVEGITSNVVNTGDVMYDSVLMFFQKAVDLGLDAYYSERYQPQSYHLLTIHRPSNTDDPEMLKKIITSIGKSDAQFLFPIHPRTRKCMCDFKLKVPPNIHVIDPAGYLDMLVLIKNADKVVTDSGGLQKEAMFLQTPCLTLRDCTEWVETVESGWNSLVIDKKNDLDSAKFYKLLNSEKPKRLKVYPYGRGRAALNIAELI